MSADPGQPPTRAATAGHPALPRLLQTTGIALIAALYLGFHGVLPALWLPATAGDFGNYYRAGAALAAGRSPFSVPGFDYPPLLAFVVAPLARLPLATARWLWLGLGELALAAAAGLTWIWLRPTCGRAQGETGSRGFLERSRPPSGVVLLIVLTLWALAGTVVENLVLGQLNPLLLVLVCGALALWSRRPALAGTLIGIAAALKLWPAALAFGFVLERRWRGLAVAAGTAALLTVGPWVLIRTVLPPPHLPVTAGYWRGTPAPLNFSLPAVALRLAVPPEDRGALPPSWRSGDDPQALHLSPGQAALSVAISAGGFAIGLSLLARRRLAATLLRDPGGASDRTPVALLSLALVTSTLSWYHYQLLQLPVLSWLAARLAVRRNGGLGAVLPLAGLGLLAVVLTRGQTLFGLYTRAFGWTAEAPALLWTVTTAVPVLGAWLFLWLLRVPEPV